MVVAIIAATILHALILMFLFQSSETKQLQNKPLKIVFITQPSNQTPATAILSNEAKPQNKATNTKINMTHRLQESTHHTITTRNTSTLAIHIHQASKTKNSLTQTNKIHASKKTPVLLHQQTLVEKVNDIAISEQNEKHQKKHTAQPQSSMLVPNDVQAHILMHVSYPKQARRHGWQGKVELQLNVQQQTIQHITLLTSSGYPILDRAAYRGLTHIHHISLNNGLYRMPIIFHLQ